MGPCSHERGNLALPLVECEQLLLQWGRVLMNAETREAGEAPTGREESFNGAAFS